MRWQPRIKKKKHGKIQRKSEEKIQISTGKIHMESHV